MIAKFVNATTADGYNPYRVTSYGFDWEIPEPDMPWSNIGYWGDHQIIYLLKLLELSTNYNPSKLVDFLSNEIFTYANVPYSLNNYRELLKNSKNTIEFDYDLNNAIIKKEKDLGSDASLMFKNNGLLYQVNLTEKLFVTLLSKLTNFIPEGGIWMNTQRPEWNDANNALVGNGISMVTLYYMRRYVNYCIKLFSNINIQSVRFSHEVYTLFEDIFRVLDTNKNLLNGNINDKERKSILDGLGLAGSKYREKIYNDGFSNQLEEIKFTTIVEFLLVTKKYLDHTIHANKRNDGLYHSYNLMSVNEDQEIIITNLYEMLEGQVAVLSSGYLSSDEALQLLERLKESSLYREDQNSYILYPDRKLPLFIEKNLIPAKLLKSSKILNHLLDQGNQEIIKKDIKGNHHFDSDIRNSNILRSKLDELRSDLKLKINDNDIEEILDIYESVFNHKSFTGRSGTFYKYEGLGSIYWHMVSKLALAVQETYFQAIENNASESVKRKLYSHYYDVKTGIGITKSPEIYGAFPTDPYSHTPSFSGVQQPGLTGQVKEDIISRFGELGIFVKVGKLYFNPVLLSKNEFLEKDCQFTYFDVNGNVNNINLNEHTLAFTYCQVPIIYQLSNKNKIQIEYSNKEKSELTGFEMDFISSQSIFSRDGDIKKIIVSIDLNLFEK